MENLFWVGFVGAAIALIFALLQRNKVMKESEGDAKMVAVGARLRPVPMPKAQPQAPAPVTTIQGNGGTGVVTPF